MFRAIAEEAAALARIAGLEAEVLELAQGANAAVDALEAELAHVTAENAELKVSLARLETKLAELQLKIVETDTGKVISLPPLPRQVQ